MYSNDVVNRAGFQFESEEQFNEYFVDMVLRYGLECFETSDNEADNLANDIIENYILPITEWDEEVIRATNHKTVFFWYLHRLYYLFFDTDTSIGEATNDIYEFFDSLVLK